MTVDEKVVDLADFITVRELAVDNQREPHCRHQGADEQWRNGQHQPAD